MIHIYPRRAVDGPFVTPSRDAYLREPRFGGLSAAGRAEREANRAADEEPGEQSDAQEEHDRAELTVRRRLK